MPFFGQAGNPSFTPFQEFLRGSGRAPMDAFEDPRSDLYNEELISLKRSGERSRQAHRALTKARIVEADDDNALLASATPDELENLFGEPRTEREWRLQKIIQKDMDAKERGARMIPTQRDYQENARRTLQNQSLANQIANAQQQRYFTPFEHMLNQKKFDESQKERAAMEKHRADAQKLNEDQFAASNFFRYMAQDRADEDARRADARLGNADFASAIKIIREGDANADEIIAMMPHLNPAQQTILRSHENHARQQGAQAQKTAEYYNTLLSQRPPSIPEGPRRFFGLLPGAPAIPPSQEEIDAERKSVVQMFQKNPVARKQAIYDAEAGKFMPLGAFPWHAETPFVGPIDNSVYDARSYVPEEGMGRELAITPFLAAPLDPMTGGTMLDRPAPPFATAPPANSGGIPTNQPDGIYVKNGVRWRVQNGRAFRM